MNMNSEMAGGWYGTLLRACARVGVLGLSLIVLALVDYLFFYLPFVKQLRQREIPADHRWHQSGVDHSLLKLVGHVSTDKSSSFINFEEAKPRGGVRVCAFGDSYTYGSEVGPQADYPSLLGELFRRCGGSNVEVLNFGSKWHGFHQTFLVWRHLAPAYRCDVALLGPASFQPGRDTTFNHTQMQSPYYLHARFVLAEGGSGVRLVETLGDSWEERFERYFSFLPARRYLRYDRWAPTFLQAIAGPERSIRNPFYYRRGSPGQEAHETYAHLLREMAQRARQVLLLNHREEIVTLATSLALPNLAAARFEFRTGFPNLAPRMHNSYWGNRRLADSVFAHLVGGARQTARLVRVRDLELAEAGAQDGSRRAVSEYDAVVVELAGGPIGVLSWPEPWQPNDERNSPSAFRGSGVVSLLFVKQPGRSLLDGFVLPLDFPLEAGTAVTLDVGAGARRTSRELGRIRLFKRSWNLGLVEISGLKPTTTRGPVLSAVATELGRVGDPVRVRIAGHSVLGGSMAPGSEVPLAPVQGEGRLVRVPGSDLRRSAEPASKSMVELVLRQRGRPSESVALARWEETETPVSPAVVPTEWMLAPSVSGTMRIQRRGASAPTPLRCRSGPAPAGGADPAPRRDRPHQILRTTTPSERMSLDRSSSG